MGKARLDRWYVPEEGAQNLVSIQNITTLSDHMAVKVEIKLDNFEKKERSRFGGMIYWKMNTKLLEEPQLKDQTEEMMKNLEEEKGNFEDVATWWEKLVKPCIKEKIIKYSRYRAKARADTIKALYFCLEEENENNNWKKAEEIKERLKEMLLEDSMGTVIRSKTGADIEEERSSLHHLNKEHKRGSRNNILKLKIKKKMEGMKSQKKKKL